MDCQKDSGIIKVTNIFLEINLPHYFHIEKQTGFVFFLPAFFALYCDGTIGGARTIELHSVDFILVPDNIEDVDIIRRKLPFTLV